MTDPTRQAARIEVEAVPRGRRAYLVVLRGPEMGRQIAVVGDEVVLGRDPACEVVVACDLVSRRHGSISWEGEEALLRDLGSTNGTRHNGVALAPGRPVALVSGDRIEMGEAVYKFLLEGDVETLYHEELRRKAHLDGLTGTFNKSYLMEALGREMARSLRHDRPLTVLLFDLDHFKAVNDAWGHLAADRILLELAQRVLSLLRREDILARFGGEEFVVVMPETSIERGRIKGERLRRAVAAAAFGAEGRPVPVTVSVGVAALQPHMRSPADLLAAADAQLYVAKRSGRNQVAG